MKTRNGLFADVPENLWNDWHWHGLVIVAEIDGDLGVVLKAHGPDAGEFALCDVQLVA